MTDKIISLVPAESGWRAIYNDVDDEGAESRELTRILAWALVEDEDGDRSVVGMVVDATDPTQIVPAPDGASLSTPTFDRYGYKVG
jgi:hypothetical protein